MSYWQCIFLIDQGLYTQICTELSEAAPCEYVLMLPFFRIFLKSCFESCLLSQFMSETITKLHGFLLTVQNLVIQHSKYTICINQINLRNQNAATLLLKPCPRPSSEPFSQAGCKTVPHSPPKHPKRHVQLKRAD